MFLLIRVKGDPILQPRPDQNGGSTDPDQQSKENYILIFKEKPYLITKKPCPISKNSISDLKPVANTILVCAIRRNPLFYSVFSEPERYLSL